MIHINLQGVSWGVDPIETVNPETQERTRGATLNFQDKESGMFFSIPFTGDSVRALVADLAKKGLDDDARRALAPEFNGGLILPGLPGSNNYKSPS